MTQTADQILERYCDELLQDQPKIDQALKNLISLNISTSQTKENMETVDPKHIQIIMTTIRYD